MYVGSKAEQPQLEGTSEPAWVDRRACSGRTFRVTGYLLDVLEVDGSLTAHVDAADVRGVRREAALVTVDRGRAGPPRLDGATIDNAGQLELAVRAIVHVREERQANIAHREFRCGCGGILALTVIASVGTPAFISLRKDSTKSHNVAVYQAGAAAQTSTLTLTSQTIDDPWTSVPLPLQPQPGNLFVRYRLVAKNLSTFDQPVNPPAFERSADDNHAYGAKLTATNFVFLELSTGQIIAGDVAFAIPSIVADTKLKYDMGYGADSLLWRP